MAHDGVYFKHHESLMSYCQVHLPLLQLVGDPGGGTSERGAGEAVEYMNDSSLPRPSTNVKGGVGTI